MTIMVAQSIDVRKARSIQKLAAMSMQMKSTARVVRVMSCGTGAFVCMCIFLDLNSPYCCANPPERRDACAEKPCCGDTFTDTKTVFYAYV
jgi:hypothetical protein